MACGTVPITAPLPGMHALIDESLIAPDATPEQLSACLLARVDKLDELRSDVVRRSNEFAYARAAERLISIYSRFL